MPKISLIGSQNPEICLFFVGKLYNSFLDLDAKTRNITFINDIVCKNKHISGLCGPIKEIFGILES